MRGGGPAGILRLSAARPDRESRPSCRIIRAAETPTETTGKKQRGDPGSPLSPFHAGKVPFMYDTEKIGPLSPADSPVSRECRPEGRGAVADDADGRIPRGLHDVITSFFAIIQPFWMLSRRPGLSGLSSTRGKKPPHAALGRRSARDRSGDGKRDRSGG